MTIKEAIKFIISKKDKSLLVDSKRFISCLRDLIPEHNKELKILQNNLNEVILRLFFDDNRPSKNRIALIKMELEDQGLSDKSIYFILESFCSALGWKIEKKDDYSDKIIKNKITENNVTKSKEVDFKEAMLQLEEAKKQFERAKKKEIDKAISKTQEAEKKFNEAEQKSNLIKINLENTEKREKELKAKYDETNTKKSKIEKNFAETKEQFEVWKAKLEESKTKLEQVKIEYREISDDLDEIQLKVKNLKTKYDESVKKSIEAKEILKKTELEELTLKADNGDSEAQNNLGHIYYNGKGVKQDYVEAFKWYKKSAEQGNSTAQYNLAIMYLKGQGIEKDKEEANKWLQKSADQGDEDAKKILSKEKSQKIDNINNPFSDTNSPNFSELFEKFFSQKNFSQKNKPKKQEEYSLELTSNEAIYGTSKTIQIPETQICEKCNGSGWIGHTVCSNCRGLGHIHKTIFLEVKIPAGVKDGTKLRVKENILIVKII